MQSIRTNDIIKVYDNLILMNKKLDIKKEQLCFMKIWRSRNSLHFKYMLTMCLHFNSNTYIVSIFINAFTICPRDVILFRNINDAQF